MHFVRENNNDSQFKLTKNMRTTLPKSCAKLDDSDATCDSNSLINGLNGDDDDYDDNFSSDSDSELSLNCHDITLIDDNTIDPKNDAERMYSDVICVLREQEVISIFDSFLFFSLLFK
jgi:hypothetical protein